MEWAVNAVKLFPPFVPNGLSDAKGMKGFRSLIKNKMVFPAFFGAKNESVNGYLHIATGLDVPARVTDRLMGDFWSTFNGVDKWQRQTMKDYYNKGYVESPTGRRRRYPLTKNQAVNYPIQSVACDIVCTAMVKLSKIAAETGKWYLHPIMNIHDDLTFCIPDNDKILEPAIETIYRTMLSPGYDFVNVPLSVSGSIGNNWLEMDEIGKFWSHKDL
jgi:DNA polymerase I-like protein with 3'-5' exonuclease and polymerase domains